MRVRAAFWRTAVLLIVVLLVLPLWVRSHRADPVFLVPLLGLLALAFLVRRHRWRTSLSCLGGLAILATIIIGGATWTVSGILPLGQIVATGTLLFCLSVMHMVIASDRMLWRRLALHAALALIWIPVGIALANLGYRWPQPDNRARVALLSSMPLLWGEGAGNFGAALSGDAAPAPIYALLSDRADVRPADGVSADLLQGTDVLLLIQPRALPPAALVTIDDWVRQGGRVLWLADPQLAIAGDFPLGDPRNPEPTEANTALLERWGVRLSAGEAGESGNFIINDGAIPLSLVTAGRFMATSRDCTLRARSVIADCRVGQGRALVIADADLVRESQWVQTADGQGDNPFQWTSGNGQWLVAALRDLAGLPPEHRLFQPVWLRPELRP